MEAEEINGYGLVIFYDCCIPRTQFASVLPHRLNRAKHIFVRSTFPESICRDDYRLFSAVDDLRSKQYPLSRCVFVTQDQNFPNDVHDHPALNVTVRLLVIDSCNHPRQNYFRAEELALKLATEYNLL